MFSGGRKGVQGSLRTNGLIPSVHIVIDKISGQVHLIKLLRLNDKPFGFY